MLSPHSYPLVALAVVALALLAGEGWRRRRALVDALHLEVEAELAGNEEWESTDLDHRLRREIIRQKLSAHLHHRLPAPLRWAHRRLHRRSGR